MTDVIFVLSFLGSTAQLRPWPPPQNPAEFLGGFSTKMSYYIVINSFIVKYIHHIQIFLK
jgi:hypothetical protein